MNTDDRNVTSSTLTGATAVTLHHLTLPIATLHSMITSSLHLTEEEALSVNWPNVVYILEALGHLTTYPATESFAWTRFPLTPFHLIDIFADDHQGAYP